MKAPTLTRITVAIAALGLVVGVAGAPTLSEAFEKNIVDTAVAAGQFTTLAEALTVAGLADTLKGPGPYTVFAPTDTAFAKLPPGTLDALLADKEQLKKVLGYHVVPGRVMAADVVKLETATTVEGEQLMIITAGPHVKINEANVLKMDIPATNGVIHIIDAVILPE